MLDIISQPYFYFVEKFVVSLGRVICLAISEDVLTGTDDTIGFFRLFFWYAVTSFQKYSIANVGCQIFFPSK